MIISEKELKEIMQSANLHFVKVKDIEIKEYIEFDGSIDEFVCFVKEHTKNIYCMYSYPNESEILITGDTIDDADRDSTNLMRDLNISDDFNWFLDDFINGELDEELESEFSQIDFSLREKIAEYNSKVDKSFLSRPIGICLYARVDGFAIKYEETDDSLDCDVAQDELLEILYSLEKELKKNQKEKNEKTKEIRNELEKILINDSELKYRKNKELRRDYAEELWRSEEYKWIKPAFKSYRNGRIVSKELIDFIEITYAKIKDKT